MKLSIITVNLNNRDGLQKTIDSVVCQTFKDFEWIIIDGGSTDGSKELIEEYSDKISYWVSEPDKGIYNAMNKGIWQAQGEYCFFLNSGDYLINSTKLLSAFEIPFDEDVVFCDVLFDKDGAIELSDSPKEITLRTLIEGSLPHSGGVFIKKQAFIKWGAYDENLKIVSDWKWYLQAIGLGTATTQHLDIVLSSFPTNGASSNNTAFLIERETVLQQIVPTRILSDYMQFHGLDTELYEQQMKIRSSYPYRVGSILLAPLKFIRNILIK